MPAPKHIKKKEDPTPGGGALSDLKPLCAEYASKKKDKDQLEAELTKLNTELSELSDELVTKFGRHGLTSAKMEGLGVFFVAHTARPKVVDEDMLFKDLRRRKLGEVIKETVHSQTLASLLKEERDNGKPDFAGIEVFEQSQIRLRKA